jgi:hypothetical protein
MSKNKAYLCVIPVALSYGSKVLVQREGLLIALGLHGIGIASLEGGTADETGTSFQRERNGDTLDELALSVIDIDGFFLHNVNADQ